MLDSKIQNTIQLYDTLMLTYGRYLAQLASNLHGDVVNSSIIIQVEALEPDLFAQ